MTTDPADSTPAPGQPLPALRGDLIDDKRPQEGRRYDAWLGGKDNFAADRRSADEIRQVFPSIREAVKENRFFLHRVVRYLTEAGIVQYLDIGSGLPHRPNVHEIAQDADPSARVVYVDKDPLVVAHARALMISNGHGVVAAAEADLRRPQTILSDPAVRETLDLTQPVGLLLFAVLHFVDDGDNPYQAVAELVAALPPGSVVAVSHFTLDPLPADTAEQITALTRPHAGHGTFRPRTRDQVAQFLDGLTLVDPGLVPIVEWRPQSPPHPEATVPQTAMYGAVGRLP